MVLVQEQDQTQKPIYFVSKVLQGPEARYQALEKAALVVVFSAMRLRHYFQSFTVVVMTDLPIRKVLQKPDVVGRIVRWVVEISEFDVQYEPRGPIKGQVYADFVAELSTGSAQQEEEVSFKWVLSVDGSSNQQGSGAGVILEGPNGLLIEQALRFSIIQVSQGLLLDAPHDVLNYPWKLRSRCRGRLWSSLSSLLKSEIPWR